MSHAKNGDTVKVHYTGRLKDGAVFDSSEDRGPLELTLGRGQVIGGFERAIEGMEPGESKTVEIPVGEAYGPRRDDMIVEFPRTSLPDGMDPEVGQRLQLQTADGQPVPAVISSVSVAAVKVDANHPLAGQDLTFDLSLVEIV